MVGIKATDKHNRLRSEFLLETGQGRATGRALEIFV